MSEEYILLDYTVKETQLHTVDGLAQLLTADDIEKNLEERRVMLSQFSNDIGLYDSEWDCFMEAGIGCGTIISRHSFYLIFKKDKPTDKRLLEILFVLKKGPLSKVMGNRNGLYFELNSATVINQETANEYLHDEGFVEKDDSEEEV